MTSSSSPAKRQRLVTIGVVVALLLIPLSYVATMAQTVIFGDPTEYTFVANMLGIAHPPGYALITLLGKLMQTLVPIGSLPWRMHLLSVIAGTLAVLFVFGTVYTAVKQLYPAATLWLIRLASALFAALSLGTAVNHWQHAIHANPHIITGTFLVANLFFLSRWWASENDRQRAKASGEQPGARNRWLYVFCFSAGLGVTHHPLTVFGFLGYGLFILLVRPSLWRSWQTVLRMVLFGLLGLAIWLYFPIRSPMDPGFGPTTMNTLNGFLDHVLARGLTESLPYFGLADQPNRQLVFWSLLRLQYTLPTILLALAGLVWLIINTGKRRSAVPAWPLLVLYTIPVLTIYAFVISLRQQDIMAYLIGPFAVVALWAGIGLFGLLHWLFETFQVKGKTVTTAVVTVAALLLFLLGPARQLSQNAARVSLRNYTDAQQYVDNVFSWFDGQGEGAVLLNDWEHMTPLWFTQFVRGTWPEAADVNPVFISTGGENPWLAEIFAYLPGGPVYLSNFRPNAIAGTEFRLRPAGPFYEVVEPGEQSLPEALTPAELTAGDINIVGYHLPQTAVSAGDFVPLTLAMRTPSGTEAYYVPVVTVGDLVFEFTTDSHLITPAWWPEEVIIERFDFALPHDLPAGTYPVSVQLKNLSEDTLFADELALGTLQVDARPDPPATDDLLANFRQRAGLVSATARANGRSVTAPWDAAGPLVVQPGDYINLILEWESLAKAEESYTVFVHLIDGNNVPYVALDYTPLGGATPTHLWLPKWLPGQQMLDPYRLPIEPTLPPGTYFVEVGMYEMVNGRRLHISDENGNLNGDRLILGTVIVEP